MPTESAPPIGIDIERFDVYSWCPDKVFTKATQVHLHLKAGDGIIVVRFKGPGTLDQLIAALADHRQDVFGAE